jgi:hypothetical protein
MGKSSSSSDGRADKTGKADKDKNRQNQKEKEKLAKEEPEAEKAMREKRWESRSKRDDGLGPAVQVLGQVRQVSALASDVSSPAGSPWKKRSGDEIGSPLRRGSKQRRAQRVQLGSDSKTSEVSASSSEDEHGASSAAASKADAKKAANLLKIRANIPAKHQINFLHT